MYAGHAGLALFAKARRPRLSLVVLVLVAYGPDWIEWALSAIHRGPGSYAVASHSLASVIIGSLVVALGALALRVAAWDAATLALLYQSHWVVDFITGLKPTWSGGPIVGLHLYSHPWWDFAFESVVVLACWMAYWRSLPPASRRRIAILIPVGLIALQAGFALMQGQIA